MTTRKKSNKKTPAKKEPEKKVVTFTLKGDGPTRRAFVNGKEITPDASMKIRNHSPDGFNWGYGGSGPAQLALATLLAVMPEADARSLYQNFKFEHVAGFPMGQNFEKEITIEYIPVEND